MCESPSSPPSSSVPRKGQRRGELRLRHHDLLRLCFPLSLLWITASVTMGHFCAAFHVRSTIASSTSSLLRSVASSRGGSGSRATNSVAFPHCASKSHHLPFRRSRSKSGLASLFSSMSSPSSGGGEIVHGFVGLGIMGQAMAAKLLADGVCDRLLVWNRTRSKAEAFAAAHPGKCDVADTPREVVDSCRVTFSMLSTPEAALDCFYDESGVLEGVMSASQPGKVIVDCATLQVEDMVDMCDEVNTAGGLFLEAPVSGSKIPAENGQLIFMCAGDELAYNDGEVQKALKSMGKADYYLGPAGKGTECKLVINMIMGTMMASLAEGMTLAERTGLDNEKIIEILGLGACAAPMFALKGPLMMKGDYSPNFPLKHQQKDLRFAVDLGNDLNHSLPVAAAANAVFVRALEQHGDDDFAAVIEAMRE